MNAHRIILACLPSNCQKLSKLVKIWRSSDKSKFAQFFETRCRYRPTVMHCCSYAYCFAPSLQRFCIVAYWVLQQNGNTYKFWMTRSGVHIWFDGIRIVVTSSKSDTFHCKYSSVHLYKSLNINSRATPTVSASFASKN